MAARPSPRFSIIEVARKAGVSPATVSRAFNQPEIVHPDTLAHIRSIAKRAGFRPNRVGRSLRSGSTRTIGLILPTLSNPVFAECFEGAERRARESGYSVMLTATGYPAVESAAVQGLMDHQVDGLILTVADVAKSATLDDLDSAGMPYVLVYNESASHPYASVDNRAAACDMVTHLAQLGHKRIALVTGPLTPPTARGDALSARAPAPRNRPGRRPAHQHELAHRQRRRGAQGRAARQAGAHRAVLLQRLAGHRRHRRPGRAGPVGARRHLGLRLRRHALRRCSRRR